MKKFLQFCFDVVKISVIFIGFTIIFYMTISWAYDEYQGYHNYDVPKGSSVPVSTGADDGNVTWLQRLIFFYENGE